MGVVYAKTFFEGKTLKQVARVYLKNLPPEVKGLLSQGTSGCSIASAMLALSRRNLIHISIRKNGEAAHHSGFAGEIPFDRKVKYAIVDDFIESGDTIKRILNWAKEKKLKVVIVLVAFSKARKRKLVVELREQIRALE